MIRWPVRPMAISLLLLLLVVIVGTFGYIAIEGWSPWDGFWMVLITLTSIGYGEVHPLSYAGRAWTVLIIISGLGLVTYTITQVTAALLEGNLIETFRARHRRHTVSRLRDHYIIVGGGRLGSSVIDEVRGAGHPVCVIEQDPATAAALEAQGTSVIVGDGANDEVLRQAGIDCAAGLAVAVPSGAAAIFVTLSARHLAPSLPIATRTSSPQEAIKARRAGATSVVSPFRMGGWRMAHGLIRPSASNFLDLATLSAHDNVLIDELALPDHSPAVGQSLKALAVRSKYGVLVVAIRRQSGEMLAAPESTTTLHKGDVIIVVGPPGQVRQFNAAMR